MQRLDELGENHCRIWRVLVALQARDMRLGIADGCAEFTLCQASRPP
jgi:hypothetical protein